MTFPIPAEAPTEVTIVDLADGPTATIRFDGVTMADLRNCYDSSSGALQAAIQAGAFTPAGPFLGIYHGDPHGTFDLEVGFPVEVSLEQERTFDGLTVRPGTNLAGSWATLGHIGSYDTLPNAWMALMDGVSSAGRTFRSTTVEAYVSNPTDTPAEELRTDLFASVV